MKSLLLNEEEPIYGKIWNVVKTVPEGTQISKISILAIDWKADGTPESD